MFIFIFVLNILISNGVRVLDKGILPLERKSVGIQFFIDFENENKDDGCFYVTWPKICCLYDTEDVDCDIIKVYSKTSCYLKPKERNTLYFVYPTLLQHEHYGYCNFRIDYSCDTQDRVKKEITRVDFDTRLNHMPRDLAANYASGAKVHECEEKDLDPLNDCRPVNCEMKYSGIRPYFDGNTQRCVKAPACYSDPQSPLPDIVYDINSNTCKNLNDIFTDYDAFSISSGTRLCNFTLPPDEVTYEIKSNCSTISQKIAFLGDLMRGTFKTKDDQLSNEIEKSCHCIFNSILGFVILISLILLLMVFCGNFTLLVVNNWSKIQGKYRTVIGKFTVNRAASHTSFKVDEDLKTTLLKEVIISDLPVELRDSYMNICNTIGKKKSVPRSIYIDTTNVRRLKCWKSSDETSVTSDINEEEKQSLIK